MVKKYPMTQSGKEKLEQELAYLKETKRKELNKRVKEGRAFCDVLEDAAFKDTMNERLAIEERIESLETMISNAKIITKEETISSVVTLGSTVTFVELPDGNEETYTISGTADADFTEHKISSESPIAKNLLGYRENDVVSIQTPSGDIKIKITNIR